nr:hypothetical protein [uncultured Carboxylicivirga sp.]
MKRSVIILGVILLLVSVLCFLFKIELATVWGYGSLFVSGLCVLIIGLTLKKEKK